MLKVFSQKEFHLRLNFNIQKTQPILLIHFFEAEYRFPVTARYKGYTSGGHAGKGVLRMQK